jgi:hypothetical protein
LYVFYLIDVRIDIYYLLEYPGWWGQARCRDSGTVTRVAAKHYWSMYSHRNNGFRLDYAFCSPHLAPAVAEVRHAWGYDSNKPERRDVLSDHAALIVAIECHKIQEMI